jgi:hypothetical protein
LQNFDESEIKGNKTLHYYQYYFVFVFIIQEDSAPPVHMNDPPNDGEKKTDTESLSDIQGTTLLQKKALSPMSRTVFAIEALLSAP